MDMVDHAGTHQASSYPAGVFFDAETGGPLDLELGRIGSKSFRVRRQFGYRDPAYEEPFICPHDVGEFKTDLASIPFFFSWVVPLQGLHFPAIVLHDALVHHSGSPENLGPVVERDEADRIMRDAMAQLGVGFVRRWLAWTGALLATAFSSMEPRWWWRSLSVLTFGLIAVLGALSTLDLLDVVDLVPWMGDQRLQRELFWGAAFAVVIPAGLAVFWGRCWRLPIIGGIGLALLFHVTAAMLLLHLLYRGLEWLTRSRTRSRADVEADEAQLVHPDRVIGQFGKGSATFISLKLARDRLRVTVTGPGMLVAELRLVTDLGMLEGHSHPALQKLADRLVVTVYCGRRPPLSITPEVRVDRQGPSLYLGVGPMSMYESIIEIDSPDGISLEQLLDDTIASGTGRGYLAGLVPVAASGHNEEHHHAAKKAGRFTETKDATYEELADYGHS